MFWGSSPWRWCSRLWSSGRPRPLAPRGPPQLRRPPRLSRPGGGPARPHLRPSPGAARLHPRGSRGSRGLWAKFSRPAAALEQRAQRSPALPSPQASKSSQAGPGSTVLTAQGGAPRWSVRMPLGCSCAAACPGSPRWLSRRPKRRGPAARLSAGLSLQRGPRRGPTWKQLLDSGFFGLVFRF